MKTRKDKQDRNTWGSQFPAMIAHALEKKEGKKTVDKLYSLSKKKPTRLRVAIFGARGNNYSYRS